MRCQSFLLSLSLLALRVVAAPLQERQDGLGALGSFVSSIFDPDSTPAAAATTAFAAPTTTSKTKKDKHQTETSSVLVGDAVTATSTTESSSPAPTSSSEIITSTSSTTSSATTSTTSSSASSSSTPLTSTASSTIPTPPAPTQTSNSAATGPTSSSSRSGNSMTTAGIAVAVLLSVAILVTVFVCIWKFCGPVKRWREKREYEKMQERTYRPALDGAMAGKAGEKGLGLSNIEQERPLSFFALAKPKPQGIKRKTIGSGPRGIGTGKSPLISETAPTVSSRTEKGLPKLPPGQGPRQAALS